MEVRAGNLGRERKVKEHKVRVELFPITMGLGVCGAELWDEA